jgi:hypothetical protein
MLAVDPNYLHRLIRVLNLRDVLKQSAGVRLKARRAEPEPRFAGLPSLDHVAGQSAAAGAEL